MTSDRSDKQHAASRLNAAKSTGPKSTEGKVQAAKNSTRHGLTSKTINLNEVEAADIAKLRHKLLNQYGATVPDQAILIERVLTATLRLNRTRALITSRLEYLVQSEGTKISEINAMSGTYITEIDSGLKDQFIIKNNKSILKKLTEVKCIPAKNHSAHDTKLQQLYIYAQRFRGERDSALKKLEKLKFYD